MGDKRLFRQSMMRAAACWFAVLIIVGLAAATASGRSAHTSCRSFSVDLGRVEGYDLKYRFYAVEVHGTTCKNTEHLVSGYLHGRGHHLHGNHIPTELSVEGWVVLLVDRHASGERGSKWFRARYS